MKYRIIALDIDGTLLNDQYEVTEATIRSIERIHRAGTQIVLCTGRSPENSIPIMNKLGLEGVLITHNGAVTVQTPGFQVLHQFSFPIGKVEPLIRFCREQEVHFDVNDAEHLYVERAGEEEAAMYEKYMVRPVVTADVLQLRQPMVKLTVFGSEERMDEVERQWLESGLPEGLVMIRSGIHFIDVMLEGVSKGTALEKLAEQLQVGREAILAMGNYYNDIDMIEFAGLGVAMDNSPDAVKEAADLVAPSNNEDGVSRILQDFCV
ncbi:Cof-type HAD-IIB family hydrolase [Paenibacillus silviterrae]|uniref:Cof-type HAD-IIB family hydrolase n=1 Tax=Paenibacillus silviterrae TaxID=3242194 RepID=UPI002543F439|nr:Cof-type HAD-IIB family hydrolase [Paenibacillus chinjuensis]